MYKIMQINIYIYAYIVLYSDVLVEQISEKQDFYPDCVVN